MIVQVPPGPDKGGPHPASVIDPQMFFRQIKADEIGGDLGVRAIVRDARQAVTHQLVGVKLAPKITEMVKPVLKVVAATAGVQATKCITSFPLIGHDSGGIVGCAPVRLVAGANDVEDKLRSAPALIQNFHAAGLAEFPQPIELADSIIIHFA